MCYRRVTIHSIDCHKQLWHQSNVGREKDSNILNDCHLDFTNNAATSEEQRWIYTYGLVCQCIEDNATENFSDRSKNSRKIIRQRDNWPQYVCVYVAAIHSRLWQGTLQETKVDSFSFVRGPKESELYCTIRSTFGVSRRNKILSRWSK